MTAVLSPLPDKPTVLEYEQVPETTYERTKAKATFYILN